MFPTNFKWLGCTVISGQLLVARGETLNEAAAQRQTAFY